MGIYVVLNWQKPHHAAEFETIFKNNYWFDYLPEDAIPDGNCPDRLAVQYLEKYWLWLKQLLFLATHAPQVFMRQFHAEKSVDAAKQCIRDDIDAVEDAMKKAKKFQEQNIRCWLSVG